MGEVFTWWDSFVELFTVFLLVCNIIAVWKDRWDIGTNFLAAAILLSLP